MAVQRSPKPLMRVRFLSPLPKPHMSSSNPDVLRMSKLNVLQDTPVRTGVIDEELQVKPGAFFFIPQAEVLYQDI